MSETRIQTDILAAIGARPALRVWRNNTGALRDQHGRLVRFGCPGSADLIGLIGPAGRFLAIEVKQPGGRQSQQQMLFQAMVEALGGLYILATCPDDVLRRLP